MEPASPSLDLVQARLTDAPTKKLGGSVVRSLPGSDRYAGILVEDRAVRGVGVEKSRGRDERRRGALRVEAGHAARVATEAANARLAEVDRRGEVDVARHAGRRRVRRTGNRSARAQEAAGVAGLRLARGNRAVDEGGSVRGVAGNAAVVGVHEAGQLAVVESGVRRLVRGLGRDHGADVTDGRGLVGR